MGNYRLLYYQPGTQGWKQMLLTGSSFSIGRAPENNLTLDDKEASRQHASLHLDARGIWIMDHNSGNGVSLGGRRIPAGEWIQMPLNTDITIGATTLRVEAIQSATTFPSQPVPPVAGHPAQVAPPNKTSSTLPTLGILGCLVAFACLVVGGVAAYMFLPGPPPKESITFAPPTVIDSLTASAGAGPVQDDQGVSLSVPADALEPGQLAHLERASLSEGMQTEIEKNYQVESLAYAALIKDGPDGIGQMDLALPAKSPDSRLAVLVDDKWLGVLETPAQDGVFHIGAHPSLGGTVQAYYGGEAQAPNRYLVVTPKTAGSQEPSGNVKLASYRAQDDPDGKSCIAEFWTGNYCWRNPEGSVYVFWEDEFPADMGDQGYLRIVDTVKAVAVILATFEKNGFQSAAISAEYPAYVVIEASATSAYYSQKTGNVYMPWDIISGISKIQNRCTLGHEFMHWIEDEEYIMGAAAMSNPSAWWMEVSADNGAFLLDSGCIERNLTFYGTVSTSNNVLGFQAAPFQWESNEQARYIHSLQFYLSMCEGGINCALSQAEWVEAINKGTYLMENDEFRTADYEHIAKDLGRFLLGAAPTESRAGAVIPPSAISGNGFGDYLILRDDPKFLMEIGMTLNQFIRTSPLQMTIRAPIAKGAVYPLSVVNGQTPIANRPTGLPGLLEIQAGPAFWLKQDQAAPVFYPAGKSLKLGPISDKLGISAARIVAVAPDSDQTFQANVSLIDLSGDWSATQSTLQMTPVDCKSFSADDNNQTPGPDQLLQYFSGYGTYVKNTADPTLLNLIWQGTLPDGAIGKSDVTVDVDKITLYYRIEIPEPASGGSSWLPGMKLGQEPAQGPLQQPNALLSVSLALPLMGAALWLKRLRRKWAVRLALASLLLLGALLLSGCFGLGFNIWGTINATYTFTKLEYLDPTQAAAASAGGAANQPVVTWKLTNGQVKYNYDLIIQSEVTDSDGKTTKENTPCKLTATSNVTGTIGPEGSVKPPE